MEIFLLCSLPWFEWELFSVSSVFKFDSGAVVIGSTSEWLKKIIWGTQWLMDVLSQHNESGILFKIIFYYYLKTKGKVKGKISITNVWAWNMEIWKICYRLFLLSRIPIPLWIHPFCKRQLHPELVWRGTDWNLYDILLGITYSHLLLFQIWNHLKWFL